MSLLIDGHRVHFDPQELQIFAALFNARGRALTLYHLIQLLYDDREDGGPEIATAIIQARTGTIRRKLKRTRFSIPGSYGVRRLVRA